MHIQQMTATTTVALVFAAAAYAGPAAAQEAVDSWHSQLEFGLNAATGNSSFSVLRTGGSLKYLHTDQAEFELSALYRYGENETKVISNDLRGTMKFDWKPQSDFSPFAYVSASRDEIRRLDAKLDGGVGAKWTVHRSEPTKLSFSLAGVLDYENYRVDAGSTDPESEGVFRLSTRVKFDRTFGSGASFQHVTFWAPEAEDFGDYNIAIVPPRRGTASRGEERRPEILGGTPGELLIGTHAR
jgi:hypothetical protein